MLGAVNLRAILSACVLMPAGCAHVPPPRTVPTVDLARYAGEWHEVASFPNFFQRGCSFTKAAYTPMANGKIRVVNTCTRGSKPVSIEGTARAVPGSNNSKLKVRFFGPFEGDYWILELDPAYRWAVVGTPNRKYLWILARTPELPPGVLADLRARAAAQGFDTGQLRMTTQR